MAHAFLKKGGDLAADIAAIDILHELFPDGLGDEEWDSLCEKVRVRVLKCLCPFWDEESTWLQVIRELVPDWEYEPVPKRLAGVEENR